VDIPEAFARHGSHPILAEPAIQLAIREGRIRPTSSRPSPRAKQLLGTYRIRAEHLRKFSTLHAEQLRLSAVAFCAALEGLPPGCPIASSSLELDHGRGVVLFERADTNELLGIFSTVDRTKVSAEEWATLWGVTDAG
jgi:hypothetical protein